MSKGRIKLKNIGIRKREERVRIMLDMNAEKVWPKRGSAFRAGLLKLI